GRPVGGPGAGPVRPRLARRAEMGHGRRTCRRRRMSYWDWAVEVHGKDGVDAALTGLQDRHDQCVAYLLWAAWAAAEGRPLSSDVLAEAAALARRWEGAGTRPLRAARRGLKLPAAP